MPVKSSTVYDTKCYGVIIENDDLVEVQKFKNIYDEQKNILCIKKWNKNKNKWKFCWSVWLSSWKHGADRFEKLLEFTCLPSS